MFRPQTRPFGFLSALGIKSTGRNPPEGSDVLSPIYDLSPHYLSGLQAGEFEFSLAQVPGDSTTMTVPEGEAWHMVAAAATLNMATGEAATVNLSVNGNSGFGSTYASGSHTHAAATNGNSTVASIVFPQPLILLPGNTIRASVVDSTLAAARALSIFASFYRLVV